MVGAIIVLVGVVLLLIFWLTRKEPAERKEKDDKQSDWCGG